MKERLDVLLVKQGLAESREKAKAVIMAGEVFVQGQREDKAGAMFDESKVTITVKGSSLRYVSRGGLKLEKAMACFPITLEGDICMDIGSSTGGFTGRKRFIPSMSDTVSSRGSCGRTSALSAWKRRISGI